MCLYSCLHYTAERVRTYGYNLVSIKVDSLARILGREITTPFFFFQLFSTITWLAGTVLNYNSYIYTL
jgi:hypothetical protein